jgi:predicted amidohydrolase
MNETAASPAGDAPETFTAALWATNLSRPLNGIGAWIAQVEEQMQEAKAAGADLLVMPEYVSEQWLSFAPEGIKGDEEIPWMAEQAEAALEGLAGLAEKHDLALLAGTMPVKAETPKEGEPPYLNRAHLFLPDGRQVKQDKLCLTPGEKDPESWNLSTGDEIEIVQWKGMKMATLICLDVEMPALSQRLARESLDLLLVPSMTSKLAGYSRVFGCAKARAVELQTAVLTCGVIGAASMNKPRETNVSGASVFVPCEEALGHRGVAGEEIPPQSEVEGPGPMLIARDLPIRLIRELRAGAAEVWPGAWTADHVKIKRDSD